MIDEVENSTWNVHFLKNFENDTHSGFVDNLETAHIVIREYSYYTSSEFVNTRNNGGFGRTCNGVYK